MPDHRETIIRIDHVAKTAEIWTISRRITTRLRRIGAKPLERQIAGQWWSLPERSISLRKPAPKRPNQRKPQLRVSRVGPVG